VSQTPLSPAELEALDASWRAANYLAVGQIYLLDNPLLRGGLRPEHLKPRLLGHWGTPPGLNFIYAHLNRVITWDDLDMIFVCGPSHGGPAMVASAYLEGSYSERYPNVSRDEDGMRRHRLAFRGQYERDQAAHALPRAPLSGRSGRSPRRPRGARAATRPGRSAARGRLGRHSGSM
jgi:xylulose-5-phosphate/fructose-6-phosphate phosphoketolase